MIAFIQMIPIQAAAKKTFFPAIQPQQSWETEREKKITERESGPIEKPTL
jgi:hypothetical protein